MAPDFLSQFTAGPLATCPMVVGGISCAASVTAHALTVLAAAPGLMIRQPLQRARNILAECDYHAEAAPYRSRFCQDAQPQSRGRGAAGRHIAKMAFCAALTGKLTVLADDPLFRWDTLTAVAWEAFGSDWGYACQLAAAGAMVRRERPPPALVAAIVRPAAVVAA